MLTVMVITDDLLNRVLLNFLKSLKQDKFHELKKCSTMWIPETTLQEKKMSE